MSCVAMLSGGRVCCCGMLGIKLNEVGPSHVRRMLLRRRRQGAAAAHHHFPNRVESSRVESGIMMMQTKTKATAAQNRVDPPMTSQCGFGGDGLLYTLPAFLFEYGILENSDHQAPGPPDTHTHIHTAIRLITLIPYIGGALINRETCTRCELPNVPIVPKRSSKYGPSP